MTAPHYTASVIRTGNAGTAGTPQQRRGLERSHINQKTGNMGTQLCLINNLCPPVCSRKKTPGTSSRAESTVLERLYPSSRVPSDFDFRRGNKGGYVLFLLTQLASFVPRLLIRIFDQLIGNAVDLNYPSWPAPARPATCMEKSL